MENGTDEEIKEEVIKAEEPASKGGYYGAENVAKAEEILNKMQALLKKTKNGVVTNGHLPKVKGS